MKLEYAARALDASKIWRVPAPLAENCVEHQVGLAFLYHIEHTIIRVPAGMREWLWENLHIWRPCAIRARDGCTVILESIDSYMRGRGVLIVAVPNSTRNPYTREDADEK